MHIGAVMDLQLTPHSIAPRQPRFSAPVFSKRVSHCRSIVRGRSTQTRARKQRLANRCSASIPKQWSSLYACVRCVKIMFVAEVTSRENETPEQAEQRREDETPEQALQRRLKESARVEERVTQIYSAKDFQQKLEKVRTPFCRLFLRLQNKLSNGQVLKATGFAKC